MPGAVEFSTNMINLVAVMPCVRLGPAVRLNLNEREWWYGCQFFTLFDSAQQGEMTNLFGESGGGVCVCPFDGSVAGTAGVFLAIET